MRRVPEAAQRWLPKDCHGAPIVRNKVVFLADGAVWLAEMAAGATLAVGAAA